MENLFSTIPMRAWSWLGVNDMPFPDKLAKTVDEVKLFCPEGTKQEQTIILRDNCLKNIDIEVAQGGEMHLHMVQLVPTDTPVATRIKVAVGDKATFKATIVEAGAKHTASEMTVELQGDDSRADIWAIYFGDEERKIDLNYVVKMIGLRTDGVLEVKGALLDKADKSFRGTLDFVKGARGATGREEEEVTVLSPHVRNRSVPLMLSHEGDVEGHHAGNIGRIDEDKLFYLLSRGLDMTAAQRLIVEAAFQPVLDRITEETLKKEVLTYLEGRLEHAGR